MLLNELTAAISDPHTPPRVREAACKLMLELGKAAGLNLAIVSSSEWQKFYRVQA